MRLENRGGDVLARGGTKAQFQGPNVSQERWDEIWEPEVDNSNASAEKTGDGSTSSGENQASAGI